MRPTDDERITGEAARTLLRVARELRENAADARSIRMHTDDLVARCKRLAGES
ncbi:hypothetical protein [Olsenella sp. HMSC062G07]|uniref:hypothetical protein n=1 Tax=Olsenella sp. HMSC062G07 TaxID=1739330 RepID=UPI00143A41AD|nr:hypothetical protein [Olsenella sp. HMSC062G07]